LLTTGYGYKSGMRIELLNNFLLYYLNFLIEGKEIEKSWDEALFIVSTHLNVKNINVGMYRNNPTYLINYVIKNSRNVRVKKEIEDKWLKVKKLFDNE
jgi:hypothetical protein